MCVDFTSELKIEKQMIEQLLRIGTNAQKYLIKKEKWLSSCRAGEIEYAKSQKNQTMLQWGGD